MPSEAMVELGKCLLGMLHYRVLSWAQFKVLIKRRHILVSDLRRYEPELIDSDAANQIQDFKIKFSLELNSSSMQCEN
jgi:hypothetical protein